MTGGTAYHAEIMYNVGFALGLRLRGGDFHFYSSAMRISVNPDTLSLCGLEHRPWRTGA